MDWLAPPWLCTWRQQGLYVPIYSCPLCVGPTHSLTKTLPFRIFLHSESWFDVSSTERSFPSNHSSVNRARSEAPQNNNNNNNDDDDEDNNSPARRRLLCPHLARWVGPTANSLVLNTNLLTGVMLLKDAGPLRSGHTVLHLPCSGARVCACARARLCSAAVQHLLPLAATVTLKHNK